MFTTIKPTPLSKPGDEKGIIGEVYGNINFDVEQFSTAAQEYWLNGLVGKIFGIRTDGEFVITLEVRDPSRSTEEQLIARRVVAHFLKKREGFLIFNRQINELNHIVFSGDLIPRLKVSNATNEYSLAIHVYKSNSTTLKDNSLLQAAIDSFNVASLALNFSPISATTIGLYKKLREFGAQVFGAFNDESKLIVTEMAMSFVKTDSTPEPDRLEFRFPYDFDEPLGPENSIWIKVAFDTKRSELWRFEGDKFVGNPNWITIITQANVGDKKLLAFLAEQERTKAVVKKLLDRKTFEDANELVAGCDNVIDAIKDHFTTPDTMCAYWAFLNQFWDTISRSGGGRSAEKYRDQFARFGLPMLTVHEERPALEGAHAGPSKAMPGLLAQQGIGSFVALE